MLGLKQKTQTVIVHTTVVGHTGQFIGAMLDESLDGKLRNATKTKTSDTAEKRKRKKINREKEEEKTNRVEPEGISLVASRAEGNTFPDEKHRI